MKKTEEELKALAESRKRNHVWQRILASGLSLEEADKVMERAYAHINMAHALCDVADTLLIGMESLLTPYGMKARSTEKQKFQRVQAGCKMLRQHLKTWLGEERIPENTVSYVLNQSAMLEVVCKLAFDRVTNDKQLQAVVKNLRKLTNINEVFTELDEGEIHV